MQCQRGLAIRESYLSVCLSVKRVDCNTTEERSVQIFIPHGKSFSLVFLRIRMVCGGNSFYLKFWVKLTPFEAFWNEIAEFQ